MMVKHNLFFPLLLFAIFSFGQSKVNQYELIIFKNGKISTINDSCKIIKNITDGYFENYFVDSTVILYYSGLSGLAKHINKGFTSLANLPANNNYSKYKKFDTLALIIDYDIKEKGSLRKGKKNGMWSFYADPFDNDTIRTFYYTLLYENDSIIGPYTLFCKRDTIAKAKKINSNYDYFGQTGPLISE